MTSRMDTVSTAKTANTGTRNTTPSLAVTLSPDRITMAHSTSDSSRTGRDGQDGRRSRGRVPGAGVPSRTLTRVGQAERPEAQVRRRVGDAAQAELDGVDGLVQQHVCQIKLQKRDSSDEEAGRSRAPGASHLTCRGAASRLASSSSPSSSSSS